MLARRILNWEGCNNVRDLGGLPTRSGLRTRWGALVRSAHPAKLTAAGWGALYAHGIHRTLGEHEFIGHAALFCRWVLRYSLFPLYAPFVML